jgi:hypothetical protein
MADLLQKIDGYKTYIAAAGLLGLAVFQASTGQYEPALQSLLQAATVAGLRHAVSKATLI